MKSSVLIVVFICFVSIGLSGCQFFWQDKVQQVKPGSDQGQEEETSINKAIDKEALYEEFANNSFKKNQIRYPRVRTAVEEKYTLMKNLFEQKNIGYPPKNIFIRVFKEEKILELWARSDSNDYFTLIKSYKICRSSGQLGPKRQEGDRQVPEGFYYINVFNPSSNFYLSMGINYPNESERILGVRGNLGGEIFIHGGCATIGCIPITDDKIKELYLIAVEAKSSRQDKIPVHIFPCRLDDEGFKRVQEEYENNQNLIKFWQNLKEGFDIFEETHQIPEFTVNSRGEYVFSQ